MARFHMSEDGIVGEGDLTILRAVVDEADPAAVPLVVPPADLLPVDQVQNYQVWMRKSAKSPLKP